jgi:hypothetical protein
MADIFRNSRFNVYKSGPVERLSVETLARDVNSLSEGSAHLLHLRSLRTMWGCVLIQGNTEKYTWEGNGVHGGNVNIIAVTVLCKVSVTVYLVFQG